MIFTMLVCGTPALRADDDIEALEEQAIQAALARVAPSVVRIETVGGLETIGSGRASLLVGTGPTSGLVVSGDGYIVSSAFNFAQKPASILVGLPDRTRTPAKLVATDHNRKLALLKVEMTDLPVAEPAPADSLRAGQWSIALGRTFEADEPNVSVGIISATNRIWGKAVQTDAKVSPANYGGPLVDIRGRVIGVLVPLAPQGTSEVAGVEWYDSGIGFAVPMDQIHRVLPRLKEGKDLYAGLMGVGLKGGNQFSVPEIGSVRFDSPAAKAGLKPGDKIVEIDGRPIRRQTQLFEQINPRYAGETIRVAVERGSERIERPVTLVAKLEPYEHPFLGVLPKRTARGESGGVVVRFVYPDSPAASAGVQVGDRIVTLGAERINGRDELLEMLNGPKPGQKIAIELRRGDATVRGEAQLGKLPEAVPVDLPPARDPREPFAGERPEVGTLEKRLPEFTSTYLAYVPERYDPDVPYGVLIWLHAAGATDKDELVARWKPPCDQHDLILLAPRSADPARWLPTDRPFIRKMLDETLATYNVDRTRIVVHGFQGGAAMAYTLAFEERDLIRGVAAVDAPLASEAKDNEPGHRLAFFITTAKKARHARQIDSTVKRLRDMKYPVTVRDQGEQPRQLNDDELTELVRWIDTLDRL